MLHKSGSKLFAAFCLSIFVTIPGALAEQTNTQQPAATINEALHVVPNFEKVSNGIWRGSAPSESALATLAQGGVKTVIDLRLDGPGARKESDDVKHLGLKYYHFPLGFNKPESTELRDILAVATNPVNQPVYIHCRQGADRTGTIVGLYRRLWLGWSFKQTYNEMRLHHFKPWLFTLKRTVENPDRGLYIATTHGVNQNPLPTLPPSNAADRVISQQPHQFPVIDLDQQ